MRSSGLISTASKTAYGHTLPLLGLFAAQCLPHDECQLRGHQRTFRDTGAMSALPLKADMRGAKTDVCFGPIADSCNAAQTASPFDHLGCVSEKCGGTARPIAFAVLRSASTRPVKIATGYTNPGSVLDYQSRHRLSTTVPGISPRIAV
jgi:hypothetical protein